MSITSHPASLGIPNYVLEWMGIKLFVSCWCPCCTEGTDWTHTHTHTHIHYNALTIKKFMFYPIKISKKKYKWIEWIATYIATYLLMPRALVIEYRLVTTSMIYRAGNIVEWCHGKNNCCKMFQFVDLLQLQKNANKYKYRGVVISCNWRRAMDQNVLQQLLLLFLAMASRFNNDPSFKSSCLASRRRPLKLSFLVSDYPWLLCLFFLLSESCPSLVKIIVSCYSCILVFQFFPKNVCSQKTTTSMTSSVPDSPCLFIW